tara:strand:+ start:857 stop:1135 length:279 start_codon:yes stop_codon:yes gene_type:complete
MSFVVRDTFPYSIGYFNHKDNEKQQLTDYLMHEYLSGKPSYNMSGSFSLQDAIEIKEALDASPLVSATIVVDETINTEDPNRSSRTITYTKL